MELKNIKLVLSLRQDLKELNRLSLEMMQNVTALELHSWMFPLKSFKEMYDFKLEDYKFDDQYLICLELIIDRLHVIINILIKHFDAFLQSKDCDFITKNVFEPNKLTLGASVNLLWKKLTTFQNIMKTNEFYRNYSLTYEKHGLLLVNTETQTSGMTLGTCDNCFVVFASIKNIIQEMELKLKNSKTEEIRANMKLFEITQIGCINRIIAAMIADITDIINKYNSIDELNNELKVKQQFLDKKYNETLQKNKFLEKTCCSFEELYKKEKSKYEELIEKRNELLTVKHKYELKMEEYSEKIEQFQKSLQTCELQIKELNSEKHNLQYQLDDLVNNENVILNQKEIWKNHFIHSHNENQKLSDQIQQIMAEFNNLILKIDKFERNFNDINKTLEEDVARFRGCFMDYNNFLKFFQDVVQTKLIKLDNATRSHKMHYTRAVQIKGDPLIDMQRQFEENKTKIGMLEEENKSLLKTIERFRLLKYSSNQ